MLRLSYCENFSGPSKERAPAGDIALRSSARHLHIASLHPGVQVGNGKAKARGNPAMD